MDMGSGAGFRGVGVGDSYGDVLEKPIELVESDGRKCRFLEAVIDATRATGGGGAGAFEDLPPRQPDIILARAGGGA